jgi:hypothetical protein
MSPSSGKARMSLARQLTYGILFAGVAGVMGEAGARLDDYWRLGIPLLAAPSDGDLVVHDSLGAHGTPNGRYRDLRLNSAGFRSPESSLARSPGCVRVMTLGASETFGTGSGGPGNEYPAQLEDSLAIHGCYKVLNAAMVGATLRSLISYWNSWASRFHPDIVVVLSSPALYAGENSIPPLRAPPGPPRPQQPGRPAARRIPLEARRIPLESRLFERVHEYLHYPDFMQEVRVQNHLREQTGGRPPEWFFSSMPPDRLESYRGDLDSLLIAIRAAGSEPVIGVYPMRFGRRLSLGDSAMMAAFLQYADRATPQALLDFMWAQRDTVLDLARRRGVRAVDLPPALNGHPENFDDFVHYSALGAKRLAGVVAHVVLEVRPPS